MKASIYLFLILPAFFFSCKQKESRVAFYEGQLNHWQDSLKNLQVELRKSEAYLSSAVVHQVTRSPEEKERQLNNLNTYKKEIEQKIQQVEGLIQNYADSLAEQNR